MMEFIAVALTYVLDILIVGGGIVGLAALYKAFGERKKVAVETKDISAKTPVAVNKTKAETQDIIIANLQDDNKAVREDRDYWKSLYEEAKKQVDELIEDLNQYRKRATSLQQRLDELAQHSPLDDKNGDTLSGDS